MATGDVALASDPVADLHRFQGKITTNDNA